MKDILSIGNDEKGRYQVIFDNKIEFLEAKEFCRIFGYKISTIYDWKYRPKKNNVPDNLFVKFRRKLHLRTDVLRLMFLSQNPLLTDGPS
ncbi:MAG: hypothetical protein KDD50_13680 [Bdellovibrionales bacterium]|nr:hypothetical protein [Bdellovibrionales bacterium]